MDGDIVDQFTGYVYKHAEKIAARLPNNSYVGLDDLIQAGLMMLVEKSRSFDPSRGAHFLTYAGRAIRGAIQREANKCDQTVSLDEAGPIMFEDDVSERVSNREFVQGVIEKQPDDIREVYMLTYVFGMSQQEVAGEMEIPVHQVYHLLVKLKRVVEAEWGREE